MLIICNKCRKSKGPEEFHRQAARSNGRYPVCKVCRKQESKDYWTKNREREIARKQNAYWKGRLNKVRANSTTLTTFFSKIEKKDSGCWEWTGTKNHQGYGVYSVKRRTHLAHRLTLTLSLGKPLNDLQANHHCDNKLCVNPNHLYVGTQQDNIRDRDNRGRGANQYGKWGK